MKKIYSINYYGNADFAESSINYLILVTKLKRNHYFSILKMFKFHSIKYNGIVNFAEKVYLFTNISYKTKKKSIFFNFKKFKNVI